jgi:hypothetical protein
MGRRKRGLLARLLRKTAAAAARHGKKHARRGVRSFGEAFGPKVQRRASEEYGGKRKAGAPIPEVACPLEVADALPANRWEFEAMVGGMHVPFVMVADDAITELDSADMQTMALIAACHRTHDQRPIDQCWQVTQIRPMNDPALDRFGSGHYAQIAITEGRRHG